jgi:hypothetical protein
MKMGARGKKKKKKTTGETFLNAPEISNSGNFSGTKSG